VIISLFFPIQPAIKQNIRIAAPFGDMAHPSVYPFDGLFGTLPLDKHASWKEWNKELENTLSVSVFMGRSNIQGPTFLHEYLSDHFDHHRAFFDDLLRAHPDAGFSHFGCLFDTSIPKPFSRLHRR
jgi:hypothetical protein